MTFIHKRWMEYNPIELREKVLNSRCPAAIGVLLSFSQACGPKNKLFPHWCHLIMQDVSPANDSQFFIGLRQLGAQSMLEDVAYSSEEYRKWGFFGRESLINKNPKLTLSVATRQRILQDLIKTQPRIRTQDYWQAIGKCISKRQAERDLKKQTNLRPVGRTKAKYFRVMD